MREFTSLFTKFFPLFLGVLGAILNLGYGILMGYILIEAANIWLVGDQMLASMDWFSGEHSQLENQLIL